MQLHLDIISKDKYYLGEKTSYSCEKQDLTIGRQHDCDWVIDDANKFMSGKHLKIQWRQDGYFVTDLSTNGTFLNSQRLERHQMHQLPLKQGDVLILGDIKVQVSLGESTTINIHGDTVQNDNQNMMNILNGYTPSHFHFDSEEEMHKEHERLADILSEEFPDVDHGDSIEVTLEQANEHLAEFEYAFLPKSITNNLLQTQSKSDESAMLQLLIKTLLIHTQKQLVIDKIENPERFKLLSISNIWKAADSVDQVLSSPKSLQEQQQDLQEILHYLSLTK